MATTKTRVFFTQILTQLMREMIDAGLNPVFDYIKRSTEEQQRMFKAGLSKCDGIKKVSQHQNGKACDIYFIKNNDINWNADLYKKWHDRWTKLGGKQVITWDPAHFEV